MTKSKDKNISEGYREACYQVVRNISKEHGEWWLPDAEDYGKLTCRDIEQRRRAEYKEDHPHSVEDFRKWAERQSEITENFSKNNIHRYVAIRNKVNDEIKKQIQRYEDEIEKLNSRIERNQIRTDKDVNELHNIFGDPF